MDLQLRSPGHVSEMLSLEMVGSEEDALCARGEMLAFSSGDDGSIIRWSLSNSSPTPVLLAKDTCHAHTAPALSCAVLHADLVASVGLDQRLVLWQPSQGPQPLWAARTSSSLLSVRPMPYPYSLQAAAAASSSSSTFFSSSPSLSASAFSSTTPFASTFAATSSTSSTSISRPLPCQLLVCSPKEALIVDLRMGGGGARGHERDLERMVVQRFYQPSPIRDASSAPRVLLALSSTRCRPFCGEQREGQRDRERDGKRMQNDQD